MLVGIDTFFNRLDLIDFALFQIWNGGTPSMKIGAPLTVTGGEPVFAGRNFLGDRFMWAHAEATNAMLAPSPEDLSKITVKVANIAPIQKADSVRQTTAGRRGFLYGRLDAQAICNRVASSIRSGEFTISRNVGACIWLQIPADSEVSPEYWAGWADTV